MEVFTNNMTIAGIMVNSECPEVPNSKEKPGKVSHLLRARIYLAIWLAKKRLHVAM